VKETFQGRLPSLFMKAGGMKNDEGDCVFVVPVSFEFWPPVLLSSDVQGIALVRFKDSFALQQVQ
jgi:hypothetical protein